MLKVTTCQILTPPNKKYCPEKFLIAPSGGIGGLSRNAISKTLNWPFAPKEDFLGKLANISITFVYLIFPIMLKSLEKSLRPDHET